MVEILFKTISPKACCTVSYCYQHFVLALLASESWLALEILYKTFPPKACCTVSYYYQHFVVLLASEAWLALEILYKAFSREHAAPFHISSCYRRGRNGLFCEYAIVCCG